MKNTKRSFIMSLLSLMLCFAMLIGTTYAWFTDSVTSGKNKIIAGNLDIKLYHNATGEATESSNEVVETTTDLFKVGLWEPGVMVYENFLVKNAGTLALKYNLLLDAWDYNELTKYNGSTPETHDLREVIKVAVVENENFLPTGTDAEKRAAAQEKSFSAAFENVTQNYQTLDAGATKKFAVILYWEPTDHDNDYNVNNGAVTSDGDPLFLDVGIRLVATQVEKEKDSFDENYDKGLTLPNFPAKIHSSVTRDYYPGAVTNYNIEDEYGIKSTVPVSGLTIATDNSNIDTTQSGGEFSVINNITRNINTEVGQGEVTYDISWKFIQKKTTAGVTTTETGNVTSFSNIVVNELPVGTNLENVKVTHSHGGVKTPMSQLDSESQDAEGYFYNKDSGILTIKSKTYSDFIVSYTIPAVPPQKTVQYDPNDSSRVIGLGDFATDKVVKLPEGIKTISGDLFYNNEIVEEIILPSTVETWEYKSLQGDARGPLAGCTSLKKVDMSKSKLSTISYEKNGSYFGLFSGGTKGNPNLETVILPNTLETIGKGAFYVPGLNLNKFVSLTIPSSVKFIEYDTTDGTYCPFIGTALKNIYWDCNDLTNAYGKDQYGSAFDGINATLHVPSGCNTNSVTTLTDYYENTVTIVCDYAPAK